MFSNIKLPFKQNNKIVVFYEVYDLNNNLVIYFY
jgi:hypothetical protein